MGVRQRVHERAVAVKRGRALECREHRYLTMHKLLLYRSRDEAAKTKGSSPFP